MSGFGKSELLKEIMPKAAAVLLPKTHWDLPLAFVGQLTASQPDNWADERAVRTKLVRINRRSLMMIPMQ